MKKRKSNGYWTESNTIQELKLVITMLNHFPTSHELISLDKYDLNCAIRRNGGFIKFRKLLSFEPNYREKGYWNEETIIKELNPIIKNLGHFPSHRELIELGKVALTGAMWNNKGENHFRKLLHFDLLIKEKGYWNDENNILIELKTIKEKIGCFPSHKVLENMNRTDLSSAMQKHGGCNKFRRILGYKELKKEDGYWTDENIIINLKKIIDEVSHFPSQGELNEMKRHDLVAAILNNGGSSKFRGLCGFSVSDFEYYLSDLCAYNGKRGKKSEKIVFDIIRKWCEINKIPEPAYNVKLSKGNVIEFVCETSKRIGIDVTNTESKQVIYRKWTRKDYHKHLDELWIVVFSDVFSDIDYNRWNSESPDNVKVMSIDTFLKELDYSIDESTKQKIEAYKQCTFHTKEQFKQIKEPIINNLEEYLA